MQVNRAMMLILVSLINCYKMENIRLFLLSGERLSVIRSKFKGHESSDKVGNKSTNEKVKSLLFATVRAASFAEFPLLLILAYFERICVSVFSSP